MYGFFIGIVKVREMKGPHGPQGDALLTLPNGFRVSLISRADDDYPEIMTQRPDGSGIRVEGIGGTVTDPVGIRRNCMAQDVVNVLCAMRKWGRA